MLDMFLGFFQDECSNLLLPPSPTQQLLNSTGIILSLRQSSVKAITGILPELGMPLDHIQLLVRCPKPSLFIGTRVLPPPAKITTLAPNPRLQVILFMPLETIYLYMSHHYPQNQTFIQIRTMMGLLLQLFPPLLPFLLLCPRTARWL